MNCLILGGAGFIGTRTAVKLLARGHRVQILDVLDPQIHGEDVGASELFRHVFGKVPITIGDVRDAAMVQRSLEVADVVLYFAAGTGTGQSMYQVTKYTSVNILGTAVVAEELARRAGQISRVVVSSSRAVYGEGAYICSEHGRVFPGARSISDLERAVFTLKCPKCRGEVTEVPSHEDDPTSPSSIYGITKLAQEQLLLSVCGSSGISAVALRYQNVYGPGQSLRNPYTGILSVFSQLLLCGGTLNIFEDGEATRDFIYIDDIAEYNCRAVEVALSGTHILNVGTGVRLSLIDVVKALASCYGVEARYRISGAFRVGDIRHAAADCARLFCTLGTHNFARFADGIRELSTWILRQGIDRDVVSRYVKSIDEMAGAGLFRGASAHNSSTPRIHDRAL